MTTTSTMSGDELLPCPFCGEPGEVYSATVRRPDMEGILQGHWVADCTSCNCAIEFLDDPEHAAQAWNTRATPSPVSSELVEALRAVSGRCTPEAQLVVDKALSSTPALSEDEAVEVMARAICKAHAPLCGADFETLYQARLRCWEMDARVALRALRAAEKGGV